MKPTAKNPWPKLLADFRDRHNLTQAAAAALVKVTSRAWMYWENGEKLPSGPHALLLQFVIDKTDSVE